MTRKARQKITCKDDLPDFKWKACYSIPEARCVLCGSPVNGAEGGYRWCTKPTCPWAGRDP